MISLDIAVWIAALFNLMLWSYLYKETRFFRFSEHTFVGLSVASVLVLAMNNIASMAFVPISHGEVVLVIPLVLGVALWTTMWTKYAWISRYSLSLMVGSVVGLSMRGYIKTNIIDQMVATIRQATIKPDPTRTLSDALMVALTISVIIYFFFTTGTSMPGPVNRTRRIIERIARIAMMVGFGTVIGGDMFGRTGMVTARIIFLLKQWLGL